MLPCYVCTKEGQKGSNLDKLGQLVSSEPWLSCKDSLWFIFKYRFEKRIYKTCSIGLFWWFLTASFLHVAGCFQPHCFHLEQCRLFSYPLSGWHICWGYSATMRVKSTNYLFILGEDPFIFTGISWDPGYTHGTILLRNCFQFCPFMRLIDI